jgi:hypothetical protein
MLHSFTKQVKTIEIKSLGDLLDRTTPPEPDAASGRLRSTAVYRGVAYPDSRLLTSLDRLGGLEPAHSKVHLEEHLLRNFIRYGKPFLPEHRENLWEIMVIAEHHGLPTRLLDWTHSPLVAAHFATLTDLPGTDRIVWRLDWKAVHRKFRLRDVVFMVEDLDALLKERGLPEGWDFLDRGMTARQQFVCILEPSATTQRLAVQSGVFTLAASKDRSLDRILEENGLSDSLTQFIIPGSKVDYIRDQLDLCTVDERRLFPGLDGIAAELRRYYSASGGAPRGPSG